MSTLLGLLVDSFLFIFVCCYNFGLLKRFQQVMVTNLHKVLDNALIFGDSKNFCRKQINVIEF